VFLLQWRKVAKARRKVRERSDYHYVTIYTKYAQENMIIIPCPDSAHERVAKARRKGCFGESEILNNPHVLALNILEHVHGIALSTTCYGDSHYQ
jgi:hypothetical protein